MTKLLTLVTTGKSNIIHLQFFYIELIDFFSFFFLINFSWFFSLSSMCLSLQEN